MPHMALQPLRGGLHLCVAGVGGSAAASSCCCCCAKAAVRNKASLQLCRAPALAPVEWPAADAASGCFCCCCCCNTMLCKLQVRSATADVPLVAGGSPAAATGTATARSFSSTCCADLLGRNRPPDTAKGPTISLQLRRVAQMPPRSCAGALLTCANVLAAAGLASAFLERPGSAIDLATAATTYTAAAHPCIQQQPGSS
jgi:hypothetical protein